MALAGQGQRRWAGLGVAWQGLEEGAHKEEVAVLGHTVLGRQLLDLALLDQLIGGVDDVLLPIQLLVHFQELVHFLLQETQGSGSSAASDRRPAEARQPAVSGPPCTHGPGPRRGSEPADGQEGEHWVEQ